MGDREQILNVLYALRKRPGMFVQNHENYDRFSAFIEGMLFGLTMDGSHWRGLAVHFGKAHGMETGTVTSSLIHYLQPDASDKEKCECYLSAVIDYFENGSIAWLDEGGGPEKSGKAGK